MEGNLMYTDNYSQYEGTFDGTLKDKKVGILNDDGTVFEKAAFKLNDKNPVPKGNWQKQLQDGGSVYYNKKFGRSPENIEFQRGKSKATDLKKLIRSQCIYDSAMNPRSFKSNSDYINSLNKLGPLDPDGIVDGYLLSNTYQEGSTQLIRYLASTSPTSNLYDSDGGDWNDGINVMPFDIRQEDSNPSNNWKYAFNNLYYPLDDEFPGSNGKKNIDSSESGKGRGLLNFDIQGDDKICKTLDKNEKDETIIQECKTINNNITRATSDSELEKLFFECEKKGDVTNRHCRLNLDLKSKALMQDLSDGSPTFRANILSGISSEINTDSDFFKDGNDLGDGLYGRWDTLNNLCGQTYMRCTGTIENQNTLIQAGYGGGGGEGKCTDYFMNIKVNNKVGDNNIVNGDTPGTGGKSDKELCIYAFSPSQGDTLDVSELTSRGGGGTTGCNYHEQPPDYYKDLNLVDKCSVDDLYEKLQGSGMRQVDLDKIEFTEGCPRRQIGYGLDFACSDKSGQFLSKSQTVESCINMREDTGSLVPSSTPASRANDCVDPAVLKAFNELTDLDGGKHPTKGEGTDWNRNSESKSPGTSHHTQLLKILNTPSGRKHNLERDILTNECYWQPILKEKEYVDEDSSCILRCKDGAIQNGSQPYCKSPPDFEYSSGYNVGYLNPYLNPEWDLNNFSCTAIEDKACTDAREETFDNTLNRSITPGTPDTIGYDPGEEDVASVTRTWNESKQMYETKIQRCRNKTGTVNIFGITITKVNLFLTIAIVNIICLVFVFIKSGRFFKERKRRKEETAVARARAADSDDAGMDEAGADAVEKNEYSGKETGMQILEIICFLSIASISIYMAIVKPTLDIPEDSLKYAVITMGFSSLSLLISSIFGHKFAGILLYIGIHVILYQQYTKFNEKFNYTTETMMYNSKPESETKTGLEYAIRSNSFIFGQFWVFLFCIFSFIVLVVCHFGEVHQNNLGWLFEGIISPITGIVITSIFYFFWGWATGQPFGPVKPGVSDTPGTPSGYSKTTIPAHKCQQYSDCKYHDNCLWDEIVSIIDGPQDYEFVSNHELDPGYTMTELMYGFIYLINKYDNDVEKPVYFRPKSEDGNDKYTWEDLFRTPEQFIGKNRDGSTGPGGSNFNLGAGADLDILSDITQSNLVDWVDSWRQDTTKVLLDNNRNDITIKELLKEYGITDLGDSTTVGASVLRKVFWYYWSYFYNGANDRNNRLPGLRPEITDMWRKKYAIKTSGAGSTVDDYPGHNVGDFYNKLISKNDDMEVTPEEVRKCIPVIRIILKDWLYKNLIVKFNEESNGNGKFEGCELINKVCTFGVNEKTGECNEACENDELLDYSHGLCHSLSRGLNVDDDYSAHMEHVARFTPDMGEKSLREFGPNFQRFYCEMEKDGDRKVTLSDDKYYQKKGCIKNDFLNHNAIPGESCGEYASRSESAGYNIDCNHSNSRVHYQYYQSFNDLPNENNMEGKACHNSLAPGTSLENKQKVCGYDFNGTSHLTANFEWQDGGTISTSYKDKTSQVTQNPITSQFANPTGYEDISPILSCCSATTDEECLIGNWITISGSDIGYCSTKYSSGAQELTDGVDISTMATDLGISPKDACNLFNSPVNVPGCDTCSTYKCTNPNTQKTGVEDTSIAGVLDPELICCNGPNCSDPGTCQTAAFGVDPSEESYTPESSCPDSGQCPTIPKVPPP